MRRIVLFVLTNLAVLVVLGIVAQILGIDRLLHENGLDMGALLMFAAVFGFGGALISLAMSKWLAKMSTRARVIGTPSNAVEQWLLDTVHRQAQAAGIGMPEVAVYDAPDMNAFATGANRNNALVAVSTGLLQNMNRDEAEAVLGHEISHVANGDMVTLALIQGVVNTFVIFFARVIGSLVDRVVFRNEHGPGAGYFVVSMIAQLVLGVLASMIVLWYSRRREFRADAGGAELAGRDKMIAALHRLKAAHGPPQLPETVKAFAISGVTSMGLKRLFMSHPPLDERIEALRTSTVESGLHLAR